jgi:hypothetical protein
VSASLLSLLERGHADALSIRALRRICSALDMRLVWDAGYRGAELGRLRDADHDLLAEWLMGRFETFGWTVIPESSFNQFGDRERIDLLGYHATTRTVVVVEIKTVIAEVQELLGKLDAKRRVAPTIAPSLGWRVARVIPFVVVAESTTNRRRLAAHARLFARFALRGKSAVAWMRDPDTAPSGLLLFVKLPDRNGVGARRAGRQRVRRKQASQSVNEGHRAARHPARPA